MTDTLDCAGNLILHEWKDKTHTLQLLQIPKSKHGYSFNVYQIYFSFLCPFDRRWYVSKQTRKSKESAEKEFGFILNNHYTIHLGGE